MSRSGLWCLCLAAAAFLASPLQAQQLRGTQTDEGWAVVDPATSLPPVAQDSAPAQPIQAPPPAVLLMLVRTTMAALNQANFTGDYSVLRGLTTPDLQAKSSPTDLGIAFTSLREQKLDLSPVLVLAPEFTEPTIMTEEGALRLKGFFPTRPLEVQFELVFRPVDNVWRIDGLWVTTAAASVAVNSAPKAGEAIAKTQKKSAK